MGATSCQMQFLLGGYSLGQPGLVIEPLSLVRNPPQAAGGTRECGHPPGVPALGKGTRRELGCIKGQVGASAWSLQDRGKEAWGGVRAPAERRRKSKGLKEGSVGGQEGPVGSEGQWAVRAGRNRGRGRPQR